MCNRSSFFVLAGLTACTFALSADAQDHRHKMKEPVRVEADARQLVKFPEPMRLHTMISMRDHLFALQEINLALSRNEFEKAASIAEQRLGMSSLERHGALHIAPFMPQGMQDAGTAMHHAASRLAMAAQDSGVTGDSKPVFSGLADLTAQCVGCHAGYRLQ